MVRLVCYNIEYCEGIRGRWYEYLQFWRVFAAPKGLDKQIITALQKLNLDILALVEVDTGSIRTKKDEATYFKKKLKMNSLIEKIKYPHHGWLRLFHHIPILRNQANAIITKYKLTNIKYHELHEGTKRIVIEGTIRCPKKVTLLLAHLALGKKTRKKQLEELTKIIHKTKGPIILMGDFNTYRGIEELQELFEKTTLHASYQLGHGARKKTQPSEKPTHRLDYVLVTPEIKIQKYDVLKYQYSDHRPVMIDFEVK